MPKLVVAFRNFANSPTDFHQDFSDPPSFYKNNVHEDLSLIRYGAIFIGKNLPTFPLSLGSSSTQRSTRGHIRHDFNSQHCCENVKCRRIMNLYYDSVQCEEKGKNCKDYYLWLRSWVSIVFLSGNRNVMETSITCR